MADYIVRAYVNSKNTIRTIVFLIFIFYFILVTLERGDIDDKHRIKRRPQLDVAEQQDKGSRDDFMAGQNSGKQKD